MTAEQYYRILLLNIITERYYRILLLNIITERYYRILLLNRQYSYCPSVITLYATVISVVH